MNCWIVIIFNKYQTLAPSISPYIFTYKYILIWKSFLKSSLRICFLLFLERRMDEGMDGGREGERERKRNISWLPPIGTPTRDWTRNQGKCPDQEWNQQTFGAWNDTPTNWATWPGKIHFYKDSNIYKT